MGSRHFLTSLLRAKGWPREIFLTLTALLVGFALMPTLIFFAGSMLLGRYEGASVGNMFHSVYSGLAAGSLASWIVLFGPYALYLLFRGLRLWWRFSARFA